MARENLRRPEIGTERRRLRWLDALFGPHDAAKEYVHSHGRKIKDVMTRNPVTVKESTPLHGGYIPDGTSQY